MTTTTNGWHIGLVFDHCPDWCENTEHPRTVDDEGHVSAHGGDNLDEVHYAAIGGPQGSFVLLERENRHLLPREDHGTPTGALIRLHSDRWTPNDVEDGIVSLRLTGPEARSIAAALNRAADTMESGSRGSVLR